MYILPKSLLQKDIWAVIWAASNILWRGGSYGGFIRYGLIGVCSTYKEKNTQYRRIFSSFSSRSIDLRLNQCSLSSTAFLHSSLLDQQNPRCRSTRFQTRQTLSYQKQKSAPYLFPSYLQLSQRNNQRAVVMTNNQLNKNSDKAWSARGMIKNTGGMQHMHTVPAGEQDSLLQHILATAQHLRWVQLWQLFCTSTGLYGELYVKYLYEWPEKKLKNISWWSSNWIVQILRETRW
jgi:hypothetical protein